jgi:transposase
MAKYSEKFKLMLVKEYQQGKLSYKQLAEKHGMKGSSQIKRWVKVFEKFGEEGIMRKKQKETYSVQLKLDVLSFMKRTGSSETETALYFGLTNPPLIASWKKAFLEFKIEKPWNKSELHKKVHRIMNRRGLKGDKFRLKSRKYKFI